MAFVNKIYAFTLNLNTPGCTDTSAGNFNNLAEIDDGSCIEDELVICAEEAILALDLGDCSNAETERALKLYTIYKAYKQSLQGINKTKTHMYKQKLIDMCNCKTC